MIKTRFLLLFFPALLSGAEYFCSPSGNDAAAGTRNEPLKTLAAAVGKARRGDAVTLFPGEYQEKIEIKTDGITLRGTRGKSGEYLSLIAPAKTLTGWSAEPAIADGMWSVPLKEVPGCVTVNGRQIILIGKKRMQLPPKKMRPDVLRGKHIEEFKGGKGKKERMKEMIPGLDLLALPKTVRLVNGQLGKGKVVDLWTVAGGMMAGWRNGKLYLRLIDGRKPDGFVVRVGGSSAIQICDRSDIVIEDLQIGTCRAGVVIRGKKAKNNTVRRCRIEHGATRISVTDGASDNRIQDNLLSLGYIRPEFHSSTRWIYSRAMYLVYKYLVGSGLSDDHSLLLENSGPGNLVEGNLIFQGAVGTSALYSRGVVIRNNVIREMSSVGIVLDRGSNQEVCGNVLIDNCINVRIHSFHQVPEGRNCFVHDNIQYYSKGKGMQLFVLCRTDHPESPENIWFYHNTLVGSSCSYFMPARKFAQVYKGKLQPISLVNNLLVMDLKSKFDAPELRLVAGNADARECSNPKKWGKNNSFQVGIEGIAPFLKVKSTPELLAKSVNLQNPEGIIPQLPGMKDHSPLPGAVCDPKMVELVRRSEQLSNEAINAMKSK